MALTKNTANLYVGSLITSIIGAALLLLGDFAGGFYGNWYIGLTVEWWITPFNNILMSPFLLAAIGLLAFCAYISYLGVNDKLSDHLARLGIFAAIGAIGLQLLAFIGFAIVNIIEDNAWWPDLGFYGGVIGGALTLLLFYQVQKQRVPLE
ncbi:MAG: hypothetical protein ACW98F_09040 [Candidatus Hodarchaeales archaeon]|jgi:hypothetical protein